jgi:signal transduction histidine kinase
LGFFAIALLALDLGLYFFVRQSLIGGIDNELQLGAQLLQQDFSKSNTRVPTYFDGDRLVVALAQPNVSGLESTSLLAQIHQTDDQMTLIARSPNLAESFPVDQTAFKNATEGKATIGTLSSTSQRVRIFVAPLIIQGREGSVVVGVMVLGRRLEETERALNLLTYTLFGGGLVVLLAAARGGDWLTKAAFRPIDEVVQTAQSIVGASDLGSRVPVPEADDELRRLSVTINDLLTRLERLFATQRRFMADVSHELRTPLAAMQGNLEVLARGAAGDPELLNESLTDMRREVGRLIRMTNDLLLLAQSDSGLQLRREPVDVDTLLIELVRELRPLSNGVQLKLDIDDQAIVLGDRDRLKQALLNLGVNALQHTPAGGSVTLGLTCADGHVLVRVSDTGAGIPSEALEHIFDRFYRVDAARTRNRGGAGLGLSIVHWIIDAHQGTISVESEVAVGSTFTIKLPLYQTPLPPELIDSSSTTALPTTPLTPKHSYIRPNMDV